MISVIALHHHPTVTLIVSRTGTYKLILTSPLDHQDANPALCRAVSTDSTASSFVMGSLGRNISVTTAGTTPYNETLDGGSTTKGGPSILTREESHGFPSAGPSTLY